MRHAPPTLRQLATLSLAALLLAACDATLPADDPPADTYPAEAALTRHSEDARTASHGASPPAAASSATVVVSFDPAAGELPEGVAVDRYGNVYVSLSPRGEIRRVAPNGQPETVAQFDLNPGDIGVLGISFDAQGVLHAAVYSSDGAVNGVWRILSDGAKERLPGTGAIGFPNDVAFDARGHVYVSDSGAGAIWRVPTTGPAEVWVTDPALEGTGAFGQPTPIGANGMAFVQGQRLPGRQAAPRPSAGGLVVANTEKGLLVYVPITPSGGAGTPEVLVSDPAALFGLDGIRIDATGRVYGAVNAQDKVVRIDLDAGTIETVADAGFDFPASLAFGKKRDRHTLYVTNFAILKVLTGAPDPAPSLARLPVGPPGRGLE